jgi:hypothetical protein
MIAIAGAVALAALAGLGAPAMPASADPGGDGGPQSPRAARSHDNAKPYPVPTTRRGTCAGVQANLRAHHGSNPNLTSCAELESGGAPSARKPQGGRPAATPQADAFWCESLTPVTWWLVRDGQCQLFLLHYTVWDKNGVVVGAAELVARDQIELSFTSLTFDEFMEVELLSQWGAAKNISVSWQSVCWLCTDPETGMQPHVDGPWKFNKSVGPGKKADGSVGWADLAVHCTDPEGDCQLVDSGNISTEIDATQPDAATETPVGKYDSYPIRCDMVVFSYTGCVVPDYTPTFEARSDTYGASAAMIGWAQTHLAGHWGLEGQGQPLHRLADDAQAAANRRVICDSTFNPVDPPVEDDSCDEFPFAATRESGALTGATSGAQCAQVTAVRNASPGLPLMLRWPTVQPLGTPTGTERCVRGHIPALLNTGLGGALGRFTQENHVFDSEAYWVEAI